jgi:hypothetical protein
MSLNLQIMKIKIYKILVDIYMIKVKKQKIRDNMISYKIKITKFVKLIFNV